MTKKFTLPILAFAAVFAISGLSALAAETTPASGTAINGAASAGVGADRHSASTRADAHIKAKTPSARKETKAMRRKALTHRARRPLGSAAVKGSTNAGVQH